MGITYISVKAGYLYLVVIIALHMHSRFVVRWSLADIITSE